MTALISIRCKGRDQFHREVLPESVAVLVRISCVNHRNIGIEVECAWNTGGHGQRCKASHPQTDKLGDGVLCAYAVDLPWDYVMEAKPLR